MKDLLKIHPCKQYHFTHKTANETPGLVVLVLFQKIICPLIDSDTWESSNLINSWYRITKHCCFRMRETKFRASWQQSPMYASGLLGVLSTHHVRSKREEVNMACGRDRAVNLSDEIKSIHRMSNGKAGVFFCLYLPVHKKRKLFFFFCIETTPRLFLILIFAIQTFRSIN